MKPPPKPQPAHVVTSRVLTPLETFIHLHRRPVLLSMRRDTLRGDADHVVVELLDFRPFDHKAKPVQVWALLERTVVREGRDLVLLEVSVSRRKSRGVTVHEIEESHVWTSWGSSEGAHPAHAHMLRRVHDGVYVCVGQFNSDGADASAEFNTEPKKLHGARR